MHDHLSRVCAGAASRLTCVICRTTRSQRLRTPPPRANKIIHVNMTRRLSSSIPDPMLKLKYGQGSSPPRSWAVGMKSSTTQHLRRRPHIYCSCSDHHHTNSGGFYLNHSPTRNVHCTNYCDGNVHNMGKRSVCVPTPERSCGNFGQCTVESGGTALELECN